MGPSVIPHIEFEHHDKGDHIILWQRGRGQIIMAAIKQKFVWGLGGGSKYNEAWHRDLCTFSMYLPITFHENKLWFSHNYC